ncbi:hypothetical protein EK904_002948 [Melospiza melodia maxima]|nr:hypothetical protein EK904_002948 [Melospiza melodia maxima]
MLPLFPNQNTMDIPKQNKNPDHDLNLFKGSPNFFIKLKITHFRKVKHEVKSRGVLSSSKNHSLMKCIGNFSLQNEMEANLWEKSGYKLDQPIMHS